jgi:hypothetical protein
VTPIKSSLKNKAIKRKAREQKKSRQTAIFSKKRQGSDTQRGKETPQEESEETGRLDFVRR